MDSDYDLYEQADEFDGEGYDLDYEDGYGIDCKAESNISDDFDDAFEAFIGAETLSVALAMCPDEKKVYDVDENTDRDNWAKVARISSLRSRKKSMRSFESYVNDICSGKRSLFPGDI